MAEPSLADQLAALHATLASIEGRVARGQAPGEGVEDLKSALDDIRLRLWGALSAAGGQDYKAFQERFRIRRVMEMCRGLSDDLRVGIFSGHHPELTGLRDAAQELTQSLEHSRKRGS